MRFQLNLPFLILAAGFLVVWQIVSGLGWVNTLFFPPPSYLLVSAAEMVWSGELLNHVGLTLYRTLLGFLLGSTAGLVCGLLMGSSALIRRALEPLMSALYTTPKVTLLPILMLLLGIGEAPKILLVSVGSLIILALQVLDALRSLKPGYVEMARNYGADRLEVFRRVYLPASLPHVFTGLRLALGWTLMVMIAVEMVSSGDGLGGMIWLGWQTFTTEKIYVGVLVAALLGLSFHGALRLCETKLIPWNPDVKSH